MFPVQLLIASQFLCFAPPALEVTSLKIRVALNGNSLAKLPAEERDKKLVVQVDGTDGKNAIPVMGNWKFESDHTAVFEPRFPFEAGLKYRLQIDKETVPFELPAIKAVPAAVTAIYPTGDKLPENLLRMYIHFDRPMKPGEAYTHLKLFDGEGKEIAKPFLELNEELWSPDMKRFTLLLDPGRIKRELKPREELGPVLEAGKNYTLIVGREWKTAAGSTLQGERRKKFTTGPMNDSALDAKQWKVSAPAADSEKPVVLAFDRALDRALLERVVTVRGKDGQPLAGVLKVEMGEMRWLFTPEKPWEPGSYSIAIQDVLEDVCGNRIGIPFEVRFGQERKEGGKTFVIPFEIVK